MVHGRSGRPWRRLTQNLRERSRELRRPCIICGQPIDYSLTDGPWSFTADHIKPWFDHPELREDPTNLAPAHRACNTSKGRRPLSPGLGRTSRRW